MSAAPGGAARSAISSSAYASLDSWRERKPSGSGLEPPPNGVGDAGRWVGRGAEIVLEMPRVLGDGYTWRVRLLEALDLSV